MLTEGNRGYEPREGEKVMLGFRKVILAAMVALLFVGTLAAAQADNMALANRDGQAGGP